jgi:hypothetical protein
VVGLAWSKDPERHPGGSVAPGRAPHGGQVESDDTDKKAYPGPPGWGGGVCVRLSTLSRRKFDVEKNWEMPRR